MSFWPALVQHFYSFLMILAVSTTLLVIESQGEELDSLEDLKEGSEQAVPEKVVFDINKETGIKSAGHRLDDDGHRHTLMVQWNPFQTLLGIEYTFGKKFGFFWLEGLFSRIQTQFSTIAENYSGSGGNSNRHAEVNNPRPPEAKETLTLLGPGLSFRFRFPQSLNVVNLKHLYQTTHFYVNMVTLNESHVGKEYQGYGIKADYGLHKRYSTKSHLGLKFSYNFAIVKRGKEVEDVTSNDRRLYLSWTSVALDYSYYF